MNSDEAEVIATLAAEGITYDKNRTIRNLPEAFMFGGLTGGRRGDDNDIIFTVSAGRSKECHFVESQGDLIRFTLGDDPEQPQGLYEIASYRSLKLMQRPNCQAVILGASLARWSEPPVALAPELIAIRNYLRQDHRRPDPSGGCLRRCKRRPPTSRSRHLRRKPWKSGMVLPSPAFTTLRASSCTTGQSSRRLPESRLIARWSPIFGTTKACGIAAPRNAELWEANAKPLMANC